MVYGFVKQSGGHVKIYSEPGHGTTVKLYLPRAAGGRGPASAPVRRRPVEGGTETILVVEDDDEVRAHRRRAADAIWATACWAATRRARWRSSQSGVPIDLLFTDVVMPGPCPRAGAAREGLIPGLAVLFTSGYTENAIVHGGRLDAGVLLLSKPYRRDDLAPAGAVALDALGGARRARDDLMRRGAVPCSWSRTTRWCA